MNNRATRRRIALMEIDIDKSGDCWNWMGRRNKSGYGLTGIKSGSELAHRAYWQLSIGEIPTGMCLLHSCDNKGCVNPRHLRVGTHSENMDDAKKRNRFRGQVGENNPRAKLTQESVMKIRNDALSTNVDLALVYVVSDVVISNVRLGKSWKHLGDQAHDMMDSILNEFNE